MSMLSRDAIDVLFTNARTHHSWEDRTIPDEILKELYELVKLGPTSANCCPLRLVFIETTEAKEKLRPCLAEGNVVQTMSAPVVAILAYDERYYDHLKFLFPPMDVAPWFNTTPEISYEHAMRNSSLQIGYFIMASRALGLDCGPMSGFNAKMLEETFLEGTTWKANILCNLGYGKKEDLRGARLPRFPMEEVVKWI